MNTLLLIERSAVLRQTLTTQLEATAHYQIIPLDTFEAGLMRLQHSQPETPYQGLILGWPNQTHPVADEIIALLDEPRYRALPVMILVQNALITLQNWVSRRPHTDLLEWDQSALVVEHLNALIAGFSGAVTTAMPMAAPASTHNAVKILFVDDSPSVRTYFRRRLIAQGYVTETASCGEEALEKARHEAFDLAIIDYFMPDMNGDVLCRRLQADPRTQRITTAILTSSYREQVIKDCLEAGAVECMFKNEADELFLARIAAMSRTVQFHKSIDSERQRLDSILNSVGDGVYGVSQRGQITFINPAAKRVLGYSEEDSLIGRSAHDLFHYAHEDGSHNPIESCFLQQAYQEGEELYSWETIFWHRDNYPIPVECTVYPLHIKGHERGAVIAFRDISERRALQEKLRWQATHDSLTELYNRGYFEEQLEQEIHRLKRSKETGALLYIDLDQFKYLNDTAGHTAGDQLLIEVANRLKNRIRDTDLVVRLGGDEFAIIMRNVSLEHIGPVANAYLDTLSQGDFAYLDKRYRIQASIGVAVMNKDTQSPGDALAQADIACHIAKRQGRNQTHIYTPEQDEKMAMDLELGWSGKLRDALEHDRFVLYYQPLLPLAVIDEKRLPAEDGVIWEQFCRLSRRVKHFEVVLRLRSSEGEVIAPNAFLPTAERFNLMKDIDRWVVKHAFQRLAELNKERKVAAFSINLSGQTLDDKSLAPFVKQWLQEYQLDPGSVTFEVTETTAISNLDVAKAFISELRDLGCRFSLDDFGTGFSSFSHLKHLPVDNIKIDGIFVQNMERDAIDRCMVGSMNEIAHSLKRVCIAEFVKNAEILRLLKNMGVDYAQGFYVSRPLPDPGQLDRVYQGIHKDRKRRVLPINSGLE